MSAASWDKYISFPPLLAEVRKIEGYATLYGLSKRTHRDKKVVKNWLDGGTPQDAATIAMLIRAAINAGSDLRGVQTYFPIWEPCNNTVDNEPAAPPDLAWITAMERPPEVSHNIRGLFQIDNLVGLGSSPLTGSAAWANRMQDLWFGMSTFKSRSVVVRHQAEPPHVLYVAETIDLNHYNPLHPPEVLVTRDRGRANHGPIPDIVTSIGGASRGKESWAADYEQVRRHPRGGRHVGLSIIGDGNNEESVLKSFRDGVMFARSLRPPFLELNPSCLSLDQRYFNNADFMAALGKAGHEALRGVSIPLFLKLGNCSPGTFELIMRRAAPFVDGFVLNNSLAVRPVSRAANGKLYQPFPGREFAGLSGPSLFDLTIASMRRADQIRTKYGLKCALIASGGVSSVEDARQLIESGADLVFITTAAIFDPLLGVKCRFRLGRTETASAGAAILMRPPRDPDEHLAAATLNAAIDEFRTRGFPLEFSTVQRAWHEWLDSRESAIRGVARRTPGIPTKEAWLLRLQGKGQ
jgi:dihydroorotate dehydrogenase